MLSYEQFTLSNGLNVLVHPDTTSSMVVFNLLYHVGSRNESPEHTGFAHLFEHLMFGGSANIASYDQAAQGAGAEFNAFTSPDITNYYLTLPAANLETAFWLESDRMLQLAFSPDALEVQRKVVIEEFKQRYLNQPYGDVWLHLRPMAYHAHPYRWATIGKEIAHIEQATLTQVEEFFYTYYRPNNATLVVAGNTSPAEVRRLADKWFGDIPAGKPIARHIPQEPTQTVARRLDMTAAVPLDALYLCFHMGGRFADDYHTVDLLSDVLGRGKSSRLYKQLVRDRQLFNNLSAYVVGSIDPGLLVIQGTLNPNTSPEMGEAAIWEILQALTQEGISSTELSKVKNKAESTLVFSEVELLSRAMNLAYFASQGYAERVGEEALRLQAVTEAQLLAKAREVLQANNCSTLVYRSKK